MPFLFTTPFDPLDNDDAPPGPERRRGFAADACYIAIRAAGFIASTYLMTLGVPLLFFLLISQGSAAMFFAHLANLADRFVEADPARQLAFANELRFGLVGLATLIAICRLPRFLSAINKTLRSEIQ